MKILNALILLVLFFSGCNSKKDIENTEVDGFWRSFLNAIEQADKQYLINHSLDSIQCADCALEEFNSNEYYNSNQFFNKNLDKLINSTIIRHSYTIYENNDTVRINYKLGNSSQIYTVLKTENGFKFQGTFPVP